MQQTQTDLLAVPHPLHPLTAAEIDAVTSILRDEKKLGYSTTRFISITLKPAAKAFIYAFKKGQPFEREAFAVVLDSPVLPAILMKQWYRSLDNWCFPGSIYQVCNLP